MCSETKEHEESDSVFDATEDYKDESEESTHTHTKIILSILSLFRK